MNTIYHRHRRQRLSKSLHEPLPLLRGSGTALQRRPQLQRLPPFALRFHDIAGERKTVQIHCRTMFLILRPIQHLFRQRSSLFSLMTSCDSKYRNAKPSTKGGKRGRSLSSRHTSTIQAALGSSIPARRNELPAGAIASFFGHEKIA